MSFAGRMLAGLGPAFRRRAGELLEPLVDAFCAGVDLADRLTGTDSNPWPDLFHLDRTPFPAWLGTATGTPVPGDLTLDGQRAFVRERKRQKRGTPGAMRAAVAATLGGSQRVQLVERDGAAYRDTVQVYSSELIDLASTTAAATRQKPVGRLLTVEVLSGATDAHMTDFHGPTDADFAAAFATDADARDHVPEA